LSRLAPGIRKTTQILSILNSTEAGRYALTFILLIGYNIFYLFQKMDFFTFFSHLCAPLLRDTV